MEWVITYAKHKQMNAFLRKIRLTETKAFIRPFVKEIAFRPDSATIHYSIPAPEDNAIGGADFAEVALTPE